MGYIGQVSPEKLCDFMLRLHYGDAFVQFRLDSSQNKIVGIKVATPRSEFNIDLTDEQISSIVEQLKADIFTKAEELEQLWGNYQKDLADRVVQDKKDSE